MFMLPLPILLVILFRSRVPLVVSQGLKYVAFVAAVTYGALSMLPMLLLAIAMLRQDWNLIQLSRGATEAGKFWQWLQTVYTSGQGWALIALLSESAFVLLLLALFNNKNEPHANDVLLRGLLKK